MVGPCWTRSSWPLLSTHVAGQASCLSEARVLAPPANPAAWPDGQLLCSITPRNGMFLKLFTLQLLLLFKSVLKIAWSRASWFAFPRSEAVGSALSTRALGGGRLRQKARLLCNASRCLKSESRVGVGLVPQPSPGSFPCSWDNSMKMLWSLCTMTVSLSTFYHNSGTQPGMNSIRYYQLEISKYFK